MANFAQLRDILCNDRHTLEVIQDINSWCSKPEVLDPVVAFFDFISSQFAKDNLKCCRYVALAIISLSHLVSKLKPKLEVLNLGIASVSGLFSMIDDSMREKDRETVSKVLTIWENKRIFRKDLIVEWRDALLRMTVNTDLLMDNDDPDNSFQVANDSVSLDTSQIGPESTSETVAYCCFMALEMLGDALFVSPDIMITANDILHRLVRYMIVLPGEAGTTALGCLMLACKILSDHYALLGLNKILDDGYIPALEPHKVFRSRFGAIRTREEVLRVELTCLLMLQWEFGLYEYPLTVLPDKLLPTISSQCFKMESPMSQIVDTLPKTFYRCTEHRIYNIVEAMLFSCMEVYSESSLISILKEKSSAKEGSVLTTSWLSRFQLESLIQCITSDVREIILSRPCRYSDAYDESPFLLIFSCIFISAYKAISSSLFRLSTCDILVKGLWKSLACVLLGEECYQNNSLCEEKLFNFEHSKEWNCILKFVVKFLKYFNIWQALYEIPLQISARIEGECDDDELSFEKRVARCIANILQCKNNLIPTQSEIAGRIETDFLTGVKYKEASAQIAISTQPIRIQVDFSTSPGAVPTSKSFEDAQEVPVPVKPRTSLDPWGVFRSRKAFDWFNAMDEVKKLEPEITTNKRKLKDQSLGQRKKSKKRHRNMLKIPVVTSALHIKLTECIETGEIVEEVEKKPSTVFSDRYMYDAEAELEYLNYVDSQIEESATHVEEAAKPVDNLKLKEKNDEFGTFRMQIQEKFVGIIVGYQGQTVNAIKLSSGVQSIEISKIGETRDVVIYGNPEEIRAAEAQISQIIKDKTKENSGVTSRVMEIPECCVSYLIGPKGINIRSVIAESKCSNIDIEKTGNPRKITLFGNTEECLEAAQLGVYKSSCPNHLDRYFKIMEEKAKIEQQEVSKEIEVVIPIEERYVAQFIGSKGANINEIRHRSRATVELKKDNRSIRVFGPKQFVDDAVGIIQNWINENTVERGDNRPLAENNRYDDRNQYYNERNDRAGHHGSHYAHSGHMDDRDRYDTNNRRDHHGGHYDRDGNFGHYNRRDTGHHYGHNNYNDRYDGNNRRDHYGYNNGNRGGGCR